VFRMLAYGCPVDTIDEYIKIRESTTIESLKRFCRAVVEEFTGQYAGRNGSLTIEAVANYDLWIWHVYSGLSDTNNDINVLEASHLFTNLAQYIAPPAHYVIQGKKYNMGYYLADGPSHFWHKHVSHDIMTTSIIMHNMIIEDERDVDTTIDDHIKAPTPEVEMMLDEST
ncbi:hypothetical protein Ddye_023739, partial [Dipteronia dyeriana]